MRIGGEGDFKADLRLLKSPKWQLSIIVGPSIRGTSKDVRPPNTSTYLLPRIDAAAIPCSQPKSRGYAAAALNWPRSSDGIARRTPRLVRTATASPVNLTTSACTVGMTGRVNLTCHTSEPLLITPPSLTRTVIR
jgi:hypothetical protein